MANLVKLRRSAEPNKVPQTNQLQLGELAINTYDGKLYLKKDDGTESIVEIGMQQAGGIDFVVKTEDYAASDKEGIIADTSGGSFVITLPASPTEGTQVIIVDGSDFSLHPLVVSRGGSTLEGVSQDETLRVKGVSVTYIYTGNTWRSYYQTEDEHYDFIQLDTTAAESPETGKIYWNADRRAVSVGLDDTGLAIDLGQANAILVRNANNAGLTKGEVVYTVGSTGSNQTVLPAIANLESKSSKTFGVVAETVAGGGVAFCMTDGYLTGLNTASIPEGSALWLSPTTPGAFTTTMPQAPNHGVYVGVCIRSHASEGTIYVKIQNGYETSELHDVKISGTNTAGSILIRNETLGVYENAEIQAGDNISVVLGDASIEIGVTGLAAVATSGSYLDLTNVPANLGGRTWTPTSVNYTASHNEGILVDTRSNPVAIALPANPIIGYEVVIVDAYNNFDTNPVTVGRNGSTILNEADDILLDQIRTHVTLLYTGTTWLVFEQRVMDLFDYGFISNPVTSSEDYGLVTDSVS